MGSDGSVTLTDPQEAKLLILAKWSGLIGRVSIPTYAPFVAEYCLPLPLITLTFLVYKEKVSGFRLF